MLHLPDECCGQAGESARSFSFEKKMGAAVLRFTVSVQLLGVTPPEPAIACSLGTAPATAGESLWFVKVEGPDGTGTSAYASYVANVEPLQVAQWALPCRCDLV